MISKYSIAVLPFVNMSSDKENEYFSDGITEEIINSLAKIEEIHVIARTSAFAFKNKNTDVREIGQKLNVALILEGSIRKSDTIVRITAQLINSNDGVHLWSESWDRELKDIFMVQDEIAAIIAKKINDDTESSPEKQRHFVEDTKAIDYYLRGKYLQNKWDPSLKDKVIQYYEKAIALEPNFSQANIGLCDMYTWLSSTGFENQEKAHQKVQFYIGKLLETDPAVPEINRLISSMNFWLEWDFIKAIENINKALVGKPSYPDALILKGLIYGAQGNVDKALDNLFQAERLNPYSDSVNYTIGMLYHYTGDFEKSLYYIDKNISINPLWDAQYYTKVQTLCCQNRFDEARETIESYVELSKGKNLVSLLEGYIYAYSNNVEKVNEIVNHLEDSKTGNVIELVFLSQMHILTGNEEKALDYIEEGIKQRVSAFLFLNIDHLWDKLRSNKRFVELLKVFQQAGVKKPKHKDTAKYKKTSISESQAKLVLEKLDGEMEQRKPFLNPSLTLYDLAEMIDVSINHLSYILNVFRKTNFYDYVNEFRLKAFLELNSKKEYSHLTLLAQAYECGFSSKSTFNTFFKKRMGTPPSTYLKEEK